MGMLLVGMLLRYPAITAACCRVLIVHVLYEALMALSRLSKPQSASCKTRMHLERSAAD